MRCGWRSGQDESAVPCPTPPSIFLSIWHSAARPFARCGSLRRIAPTLEWDDPALLSAAARVAWGFRALYNQPDTVALLRRESDDRYWHSAISHGARNNLQAVLDEYVHCLVESEGL